MKPYDVKYTVRTMQEITDMQNKEVKNIASLLEVPVSCESEGSLSSSIR